MCYGLRAPHAKVLVAQHPIVPHHKLDLVQIRDVVQGELRLPNGVDVAADLARRLRGRVACATDIASLPVLLHRCPQINSNTLQKPQGQAIDHHRAHHATQCPLAHVSSQTCFLCEVTADKAHLASDGRVADPLLDIESKVQAKPAGRSKRQRREQIL